MSRAIRLAAASAFAGLVCVSGLSAQQRDTPATASPGTAALAGVVTTDEATPRPLRRALVTVQGAEIRGNRQTVTDDSGRFVFAALPAGRYTLTAEKPAYLKTFYGSRRAGRGPGTPIALAAGQRVIDIAIPLIRGAVIAGTIMTENGVPLSSAQVSAQQRVMIGSERRFAAAPVEWATTDDRGRYRIYGLAPGEYTVRATAIMFGDIREVTATDLAAANSAIKGVTPASIPPVSSRPIARVAAYFPGVPNPATADTFVLAAGAERTGVDINVPLVRSSRVEAISLGPDGQPMTNVMIGMANARERTTYTSPGAHRPGPDGKFTLGSVPSGEWALVGRGADPGTALSGTVLPYWAQAEFAVSDQDVVNVVLQFERGVSVSGKVRFQGTTPPPVAGVRLQLSAVGAMPGAIPVQPATVQADGSFAFAGVAPGRYRISSTGSGSWSLRAATLDGRDTLDGPFELRPRQDLAGLEIVFTDQPTEVTGTLFDQLDRPTPEYAVVLFPTDRSLWTTSPRRLTGAVKLGSDGTFKVVGLPPGEYFLGAITDVEPAQLSDPSFLEMLATSSMKITLAEGEKKVQSLKIGG